MPLPSAGPTALYAREQIPIPPYTLNVLKEYQKATLRHFRGRKAVSAQALLQFSQTYFSRKDAAAKARLQREEEYRREWSGKKGEVRELFQQFDANGDGTIDFAEVQAALSEVTSFFGYSMEAAGQADWAPQDETGAKALFAQLDADADGRISWEEFWDVISTWMDTNFDKIEAIRAREEAAAMARERAAEEELQRQEQLAEEAAAAEAARYALAAKLKAEADEKARAEKAAADRLAAIQRAEDEAAAAAAATAQLARRNSNLRAASKRLSDHSAEVEALAAEAEAAKRRSELQSAEQRRQQAAPPAAEAPAAATPAEAPPPSHADERQEARRRALEAVQAAGSTSETVEGLIPALIAALAEAGAGGGAGEEEGGIASASDCVALRRKAAASAGPGQPREPPLFVAITPATADGSAWHAHAAAGGAHGAAAADGGEEETPLITVVWATEGHPHVAPGHALQRITELPVETCAFAALDSALVATERAGGADAADHGAGRAGAFVSAPLRHVRAGGGAQTDGGRGKVLGVVGSGACTDPKLAHNPALCQFVALRQVRADGAVEADVAMATAAHPLEGVREGTRWTLPSGSAGTLPSGGAGGASGEGGGGGDDGGEPLSRFAAFCLDLLANPPQELLAAAARGDTSVWASYHPLPAELGLGSAPSAESASAAAGDGGALDGGGGFLAASSEVRLRLILEPSALGSVQRSAAAAAGGGGGDGDGGNGEGGGGPVSAASILGLIGVGPEAATFEAGSAASAKRAADGAKHQPRAGGGDGGDGGDDDDDDEDEDPAAEADVVLQVVATPASLEHLRAQAEAAAAHGAHDGRAAAGAALSAARQHFAPPSSAAGSTDGSTAAVGLNLRSPFAAAEAAAAGGPGLLPLESIAHASYSRAEVVVDGDAQLVALPLLDGKGRRLGVLTTRAPAAAAASTRGADADGGAASGADEAEAAASMAYLHELAAVAAAAIDAINGGKKGRSGASGAAGPTGEGSAGGVGEGEEAADAAGGDGGVGGNKLSAARATAAAESLVQLAVAAGAEMSSNVTRGDGGDGGGGDGGGGDGGGGGTKGPQGNGPLAGMDWAMLNRASALGSDGAPVPAFVAIKEGSAPRLHVVAATPLHPLSVTAGQTLVGTALPDVGDEQAVAAHALTPEHLRRVADMALQLLEQTAAGLREAAGPRGLAAPAEGSLLHALQSAHAHGPSGSGVGAGRAGDEALSSALLSAAAALAAEPLLAAVTHALPADGAGGPPLKVQLTPLVDSLGRAYGVLVTGSHQTAVPAYQAQLSAYSGVALAEAIRQRKLRQVLATGEQMIEMALGGKDVSVTSVAEGTKAKDGSEHVLVIKDDDGSVLHTLIIKHEGGSDFTEFDVFTLNALGGVVAQVFNEVEDAPVTGDDDGLESTAKRLPELLMQRVREKLVGLTSNAISELKSYHKPPDAVSEVMRSAFLLTGKDASTLKTWPELKAHITRSDLQAELAAVDPSDLSKLSRWAQARKSAKGLDVELAWKKGSKASALIYEWLQHSFVAHDLFKKLRMDALRAANATPQMQAELQAIYEEEERQQQADAAIVMQRHMRGLMARKTSSLNVSRTSSRAKAPVE